MIIYWVPEIFCIYNDNVPSSSIQVLKRGLWRPVFKYAKNQQELASWHMMDRFPLSSYSYSWDQKWTYSFDVEIAIISKNFWAYLTFGTYWRYKMMRKNPQKIGKYWPLKTIRLKKMFLFLFHFCCASCAVTRLSHFITIFKHIFIIHGVTSNLHRIFSPSEQMEISP